MKAKPTDTLLDVALAPPPFKEGFCAYCRFKVFARGDDHVLEALTEHVWYCPTRRLALATVQAPTGTV